MARIDYTESSHLECCHQPRQRRSQHRRELTAPTPTPNTHCAASSGNVDPATLDLELVVAILLLGHGHLLGESVARGSILLTGDAVVFGQKTQMSPGQLHALAAPRRVRRLGLRGWRCRLWGGFGAGDCPRCPRTRTVARRPVDVLNALRSRPTDTGEDLHLRRKHCTVRTRRGVTMLDGHDSDPILVPACGWRSRSYDHRRRARHGYRCWRLAIRLSSFESDVCNVWSSSSFCNRSARAACNASVNCSTSSSFETSSWFVRAISASAS